jgi:hypothetical protein
MRGKSDCPPLRFEVRLIAFSAMKQKEAKFTTADFRKWLQASDNEEIFDASDPIWTLVAVNDKPSFTASSAVIATTASSGNSASSSSSSK